MNEKGNIWKLVGQLLVMVGTFLGTYFGASAANVFQCLVCMASRYPSTKVLDYCFNPVRLNIDDSVVYVPCGKCDGCLLHKANEWSMRLGAEIEDNTLCIFFTLTYNNKYLPYH